MVWCMKSENKCKRKGIKVLPALGEKSLAKRMEENEKKMDWSLDRVVWREKVENFWKKVSLNTWRIIFKKILSTIFDRSKNRFDRLKKFQLIQHQSSTDRNRQRLTNIFNCNVDWSKNNFDWSKLWKKSIFWKTKQNNAETPQSIEFYESHAWVWDEMFFKNICFEPSFPKIKIFNPVS